MRYQSRVGPIGSSPRGRGTQQRILRLDYVHRFIPAWAGNTRQAQSIPRKCAVHPRVGGEHLCSSASTSPDTGSSPRGRGTPDVIGVAHDSRRFIPAWAGNTPVRRGSRRRRTVHPRVGGEHRQVHRTDRRQGGSSPRGRGTHPGPRGRGPRRRFIPALAGNTRTRASPWWPRTVHPRVGGEHPRRVVTAATRAGSSPRGRGTQPAGKDGWRSVRFIPAWAGNTPVRARSAAARSVHPRVGGEHGEQADLHED